MKDDQLVQRLMATFLDELQTHVSSLGSELLALENQSDPEQRSASWKKIFRAAHTLKGASAVVDVMPIHTACHRLEDILQVFRDHDRAIPEDLTSTLLKAVDGIEELGMRLRAEQDFDGAPLLDILPELEILARSATDSGSPDGVKQVVEVSQSPSPIAAQEEPVFEIEATLLPVFLEELEERCATISEDAIAMETVTDVETREKLLTNLFRSAHSLKGAAAVVKLAAVKKLCHRLEDCLDEIRAGEREFTTVTTSALLEAVDAIRAVGARLQEGKGPDEPAVKAKAERIDALLAAKDSAGVAPDTPDVVFQRKRDPLANVPAEKTTVKKSESGGQAAKSAIAPAELGTTIRVSAQKLDALLSHSGELLVARGRLDFRSQDAAAARDLATELKDIWRQSHHALRSLAEMDVMATGRGKSIASVLEQTASHLTSLHSRLDSLASGMESDCRLLHQTCGLLDDDVYHVRMLPFSDACGSLQRAIRDIATTGHKKIDLKLIGGDVEVDRSVLEGLKDPLLHLVRNAADHGVETSSRREENGKPPTGTVTVSAELRGGQVQVLVQDDGAGLDLRRIRDIARKREIEIPEDPREQARLIFAPGFSTAKLITDISGRGVGLDVVQSQVEALHGSVDVSFSPNRGTKFTLNVPLTLTTIRSMLVVVTDQTYAIPTSAIQRLVRFGPDDVKSSAGRPALLLGESPTAVVTLASTLGLSSRGFFDDKDTRGPDRKGLAIVLSVGEQRVAVVVDEVLSEQEVLVKNLGARVKRLRHFSGCTVLPTGHVALVINSANVVRTALGWRTQTGITAQGMKKSGEVNKAVSSHRLGGSTHGKSLLLAEDSVTTRVLLKNILESAGFVVVTATDGQHAWEQIQEQPFDILVTDVDMPRMDGFELTSAIRQSESLSDTPVVLVTSRGSDSDKRRGVQAGANAYIVKGSFEQQNLLDTLAQLV